MSDCLTVNDIADSCDLTPRSIQRKLKGTPPDKYVTNEKNMKVRAWEADSLPTEIKALLGILDLSDEDGGGSAEDRTKPAIQELLGENARLKKKLLQGEGLEDIIVAMVEEVHKSPPVVVPPTPREVGEGGEEIAVVHISDVHIGKVTPTYDTQVAKKRLNLLAKKVVEITDLRRSRATIKDLRVYLGGDMVEGEIGNYSSQPYNIDSTVIDQATYEGPAVLESVLTYWLKYFENIRVIGVVGNHGRGRSRRTVGSKKTNWDRVLYRCLEGRLKGAESPSGESVGSRISFDIPDDEIGFDRVFDWGNLIAHGHQVRGWSGIPWYGMKKKVWGWGDDRELPLWDYLYLGHFHTMASGCQGYKMWLVNGSTESSNVYARESYGATSPAVQRLCYYTARHGLICDHPVYLMDKSPECSRYKEESLVQNC